MKNYKIGNDFLYDYYFDNGEISNYNYYTKTCIILPISAPIIGDYVEKSKTCVKSEGLCKK